MRRSAVTTHIPCELRDLDGSYLLVEPLGDIRCRILASNVATKGEVLYKSESMTWSEAMEDLGGWTRLLPSQLLGGEEEERLPDPENLREVLDLEQQGDGGNRRHDPEREAVDPTSLREA